MIGFHLIQFLFFVGRYLPSINTWICRLSAWLDREKTVAVDDSWRVFNMDCKVRCHHQFSARRHSENAYGSQYPQFTTEWAIPYEQTETCLRELRDWLDEEHADPQGLRPHFPIEIRFSDVDDIWLSPSFGQRTTWIGIIQYKYVIRSYPRVAHTHTNQSPQTVRPERALQKAV